MTVFVKSLKRLYANGKVTEKKLKEMFDSGKISDEELDFIKIEKIEE